MNGARGYRVLGAVSAVVLGLALGGTPAAAQSSRPSTAPAVPAKPQGNGAQGQGGAPGNQSLFGLGDAKDGTPVAVEADQGIEWQDKKQLYIARGNAKATRGDVTVYGQVLQAYYRKTPSGGSDIWRLEALDKVKITTPNDTAVGDKAVYDIDHGVFVLTGKHLELDMPKAKITARDSLEYWQLRNYAVARGDATAVRDDKTVKAKVLTAHFSRDKSGQQKISNIEAFEDVVITTSNAVARAMYGDYNLESGIATLKGQVKITRGKDQLNGECAEVNLNTGISRLFSCTKAPVRGLLVPKGGESGTPQGKPSGKTQKP
jgi:lipopolysaccharide export system protein LptA